MLLFSLRRIEITSREKTESLSMIKKRGTVRYFVELRLNIIP
jgi:hypothetical protein